MQPEITIKITMTPDGAVVAGEPAAAAAAAADGTLPSPYDEPALVPTGVGGSATASGAPAGAATPAPAGPGAPAGMQPLAPATPPVPVALEALPALGGRSNGHAAGAPPASGAGD